MQALRRQLSRKVRSTSSGAAEAPLEASHVAVEVDCSVQLADLQRQLEEAKAQVRLRDTRLDELRAQRASQQREIDSLRQLQLSSPSESTGGPAPSVAGAGVAANNTAARQAGPKDAASQCALPFSTHSLYYRSSRVASGPALPVAAAPNTDVVAAPALAPPVVVDASSPERWTLASWVSSMDMHEVIAAAILPRGTSDELGFLRGLGALEATVGRARLVALLTEGHALGMIADALWAGAQELVKAKAATGAELNSKFLQDGAALLSYGDLSTFFGGLEAKIGAPNPKVYMLMAEEHMQREDSNEEFTSGNYGIRTCSSIEWRFVAEPDAEPDEGWPEETKLRKAKDRDAQGRSRELSGGSRGLLQSGANFRTAWAREDLKAKLDEVNTRLHAADEPQLDDATEGVGARLYTGPLFIKYNAVLRGIDSEVPFLKNDMVQRCCAKATADEYMGGAQTREAAKGTLIYETVRAQHLNAYVTTLHAINSAVVKLSKLTRATKVFRGIAGRVLPEQFWKVGQLSMNPARSNRPIGLTAPCVRTCAQANTNGVRGGIEGGFMSTTTDEKVAKQYASSGTDGVGFVFEIQQGMGACPASLKAAAPHASQRHFCFLNRFAWQLIAGPTSASSRSIPTRVRT